MAESLRNNDKVELHEQLNFKDAPSELFRDIDIIVTDVSFISLKHIIDRIAKEENSFELLFLIKPQFECGKELAHKHKGIIRDKQIHIYVITDIIDYFKSKGYAIIGLETSKIEGKNGNVEYLGHFVKDIKETDIDIENVVLGDGHE